MNRVDQEKVYWDKAALDTDVDEKYIADVSDADCLDALGRVIRKSGDKVLEIGCGVGRLMQDGYHGIDISENMLTIARKRKTRCKFVLNDGRTIPYPDDYFDSIYAMLVFQHMTIDGIRSYICEVSRVLNSRGRFRFQFIEGTEQEPFSHHYSLNIMESMLLDSAFNIKKVEKGLVHPSWTWITATL